MLWTPRFIIHVNNKINRLDLGTAICFPIWFNQSSYLWFSHRQFLQTPFLHHQLIDNTSEGQKYYIQLTITFATSDSSQINNGHVNKHNIIWIVTYSPWQWNRNTMFFTNIFSYDEFDKYKYSFELLLFKALHNHFTDITKLK